MYLDSWCACQVGQTWLDTQRIVHLHAGHTVAWPRVYPQDHQKPQLLFGFPHDFLHMEKNQHYKARDRDQAERRGS
jgi:hypothetical protein